MNKSKKLLSILMALMMMLSVVPFYASAEAVALTTANVVEWPTVKYKNADGMYYYEQPIEDGLELTGGVVTTDGTANGTVIEGEFQFNYEERSLPTSSTASRAYIKFVPNDTDKYTGFSVDRSTNVTFVVTKTTPIFVDETNDPVVATEVEAGATLASSTLSGGKVINPYNANAPKLAASSWAWTKKNTVVNESGYYEARLVCGSYNIIYAQVYVKVSGDEATVEIEEMPSIADVKYQEGLTAGDLIVSGGKASVPGEFKVKDASQILVGGKNTVAVVFVPEDTTLDAVELSVTVSVEKLETVFVDKDGNKIIPEIKVPYKSECTSSIVKSLVEKLDVNCGEFSVTYTRIPATIDTTILAEYEYKVAIQPKNNNYETSELLIKLIVEPLEVSPYFIAYGNDEYEITTGNYQTKPKGTYDLYVNGELVMEDIAYQTRFTWRPEKSGNYTLKAVYNPVENDTFKVNDAVREMELMLTWKINCINCGAYDYKCGETARVNHSLGDKFGGWVFYDENGNEFTPENVVADESTSSVKFTMPDFSLTVEAKEKGAAGSGSTDGGIDLDNIFGNLGDLTEGDSDNPIVNIFNNIIAFFKNIIVTITELFRSIGDAS